VSNCLIPVLFLQNAERSHVPKKTLDVMLHLGNVSKVNDSIRRRSRPEHGRQAVNFFSQIRQLLVHTTYLKPSVFRGGLGIGCRLDLRFSLSKQ